jgi:lactoylglutathione lyase
VITGIGHTAYRVQDLDAALRFYCDVLGFQELFRLSRDTGETWLVYLRVNDTTYVELFPGGEKSVELTPKTRGYAHLCLTVDDLPATLRELAGRGLVVDGEPKQGRDLNWQYWVTDPDGNRIELMQMMPDSLQAQAIARLKGG